QALGPLVHAIEIDSTVAAFHNNLGLALERTGHITQATESYRAALGIDSTSQKASVNLTRVAGMKQDPAVVAVDLRAVAQAFVEQSKTWRWGAERAGEVRTPAKRLRIGVAEREPASRITALSRPAT